MDIKKKLEDLPLNAVIAFTATCMRRIQSTYELPADTPDSKELADAIETAIGIADRFSAKANFSLTESQDIQNVAEKVNNALSGAAPDLAQLALKFSQAVADILCVKVAEDPNTRQIWEKAIENHTWDISQDILADETRGTLAAREAVAGKRRHTIAMEAANEAFSVASEHVNSDLLLSDLESVAAQYKTDAG